MSIESLVIDPNLSGRLRFKQAAQLLSTRVVVSSSTTLLEGLERIEAEKRFDVVYVSSHFDSAIVQSFLNSARRTPHGSQIAYMMILPEAMGEVSRVASYSLAGVDGFLLSPFSADSFEKSLHIAAAKKHRLSGTQRKAALEVVVRSIFAGLKEVRTSAKLGNRVRRARKILSEASGLVSGLDGSEHATYFDLLIRYAENAKPSIPKGVTAPRSYTRPYRVYRPA